MLHFNIVFQSKSMTFKTFITIFFRKKFCVHMSAVPCVIHAAIILFALSDHTDKTAN